MWPQTLLLLQLLVVVGGEPAVGNIFGSLLGGGSSAVSPALNNQPAPQQMSPADLHQSYKDGQTSDKVTLPGDILLGGLFPIHMKGVKVECGEINRDRGIQRLEAMLYALDRINADAQLLPGIKLGAILLDSCSSSTYALNQSLEFIRASINTVESSAFECKDKSTPRPKYGSKMIAGVIGGSYSEVSLQVANLLRLFRIPQVSYASTGTALSDKTLYDLFARTVPSDMFQARAIADIVLRLNWSYVSLVSSEGLYGDSGSKEFMKQASVRRICIATHEKISPTTGDDAYDSIVASLEKRNATGVVLFTRAEDTRELLLAVKRANLTHNFAWVAADGWGTHQKLVEGVEEVAWGAITVELQAKAIPGFDRYMKALTPWQNARNPWFSEYWQEWFDCQLQASLLQQQQVASGAYSRRALPLSWEQPAPLSDSSSASGGSSPEDTDNEYSGGRSRRNVSISQQQQQLPFQPVSGLAMLSSGAPVPARVKRLAQLPAATPIANMKQFCSPNLRISESNGYRQEQKVQFVVDAVYAMAHALHKAWFNLCSAQPGLVCEALKELNGGDFYAKYLLNVSFKDLAGSEVKFDDRGDGLGRYNIYNFRQARQTSDQSDPRTAAPLPLPPPPLPQPLSAQSLDEPSLPLTASGQEAEVGVATADSSPQVEHIFTSNSDFEYSTVGRWTESDYYLQLDDIEFLQGERSLPESFCSRPCELGQAKIMRAGDHCCWICKTCQPYEYLPDEFSCRDCGIGRWPVANKTSCFELPQKYLRWDSVYSLISLTTACLGIALTIFVSIIFIKYLDTPVVKASGRELSFILLAGIAFCHLSTFVLLSKPTTFICGSQRFLVNFGFSLMYASLLVKTNRISRIFNCARKSAKRPSFISPKSQMLITGILVAIQIFLTIVWFVFEPPGIRADSPEGKRDEVILKCRAKGKSFIISLVYNMILITTCTVYAVKTRKIPENFNESKFIGFTMYTTIVIWLAFVTMFFGTNNSYEIQINTMCVCISLSAYVTLFCLFSPKVSIILLHPDKNVRKLTMNSATYKRPFKPVSSAGASQDGRNNTTGGAGGGAYNGVANDQGSGGPVSTTSQVLNLDAQAARLQESSTVSNVVNSTSAASNCSQKTPAALSQQQLTLLGSCANCGAHQLAQMPVASAVDCFSTSATTASAELTGASHSAQTRPNSSMATDRQSMNKQLAGSKQQVVGANQCRFELSSRSSMNRSAAIVVASASGSNLQGSATTAKVMHSRIAPPHRHDLAKQHSHDDQLVTSAIAGHAAGARSSGTGTGLGGNSASQKSQQLSRKQVGSLSRLNELAGGGTTSGCGSDRRCLVADSNSSLVNELDSLTNTNSQDNTPCNAPGAHRRHQLSSGGLNQAATGTATVSSGTHYFTSNGNANGNSKGSDSMLWNQSVYSIDYCSDCCPSYCHCSCQACSSSNGATCDEQAESGATCVHANNHNGDTEADDYEALCDSLLVVHDDTCPAATTTTTLTRREAQPQSSVRRRKSEEPDRCIGGGGGSGSGDCGAINSELLHYFGRTRGSHAALGDRGLRERDDALSPAPARRSQTMEMRPLGPDLSAVESATSGTKLRAGSSGRQPTGGQQQQQRDQQKQSNTKSLAGAGAPVAFALQVAATSALGSVSQVAAAASAGTRKFATTTSSRDKFSEKSQPARADQMHVDSESNAVDSVSSSQVQQQVGGTIRASIEIIKSTNSQRRRSSSKKASSQQQHQHQLQESSCSSYHDDYEYSYGFAQSNSDSENCYYQDEDSAGDLDTGASSVTRDDLDETNTRSGYDDYDNDDNVHDGDEDDEDDFEHDGRVSLTRTIRGRRLDAATASATSVPVPAATATAADSPDRHIYGTTTADGRQQLQRHARPTSRGQQSPLPAGTCFEATAGGSSGSSKRTKNSQLEEHRINSVAMIAATLSAGGAIVDSSGSTDQSCEKSPLTGDR